jgi:hypothetical protein
VKWHYLTMDPAAWLHCILVYAKLISVKSKRTDIIPTLYEIVESYVLLFGHQIVNHVSEQSKHKCNMCVENLMNILYLDVHMFINIPF